MKPTLFTVSANGHERHVFTDSPAKALTWCLSHDDVIGQADTIVLQRRTDVVDLDKGSAKEPRPAPAAARSTTRKPIPPPVAKKPAKAKRKTTAGADEISTGETATRLGVNLKNVGNLATKGWITRGSYGHITLASVETCEKNMASGKWKKPVERTAPRKRTPSTKSTAAPKPAPKPTPAASAPAERTPPPDKFDRIEKVAKRMNMDEIDVAAIKKQGNVGGGYGWVNVSELERYMASPEYQAPTAL